MCRSLPNRQPASSFRYYYVLRQLLLQFLRRSSWLPVRALQVVFGPWIFKQIQEPQSFCVKLPSVGSDPVLLSLHVCTPRYLPVVPPQPASLTEKAKKPTREVTRGL